MPSRDASTDCGAKAKATKFKMEPVTKMQVPTTYTIHGIEEKHEELRVRETYTYSEKIHKH
jgi:hypothetical protein